MSDRDQVRDLSHQAWVRRKGMALLTDFYELTMLAGYHHSGKGSQRACFDYFFRDLPPDTGYAIFTGLEAVLEYLDGLHFTGADIDYLRTTGQFRDEFLEYLRDFRLEVDVWAPKEGTLVFPYAPILRTEGPLSQVQLLETALLNLLNYPTLIATRASRVCHAAEDDPVIEFGARRAQGPDGGLSGARAACIGGCVGTSNVLAGKHFGVDVSGTMAHSWVMSFPTELESFRAYVKAHPKNPILLVDTYDDLESGIPNAIKVFEEMKQAGNEQRAAIRLDSGDLAKLSKEAHRMLTEAGFKDPLIVASSELEEDLIADLKRQGAKINAWGVGTHLITSKGAPSLSGVYKLAAVEDDEGGWKPKLKISSNVHKTTDPGVKKTVRHWNLAGEVLGDVIYGGDEQPDDEEETVVGVDRMRLHHHERLQHVARREPLARQVFRRGERIVEPEDVDTIRDRAQKQLASLPAEMRRLRNPAEYPVLLSPELARIKEELIGEHE